MLKLKTVHRLSNTSEYRLIGNQICRIVIPYNNLSAIKFGLNKNIFLYAKISEIMGFAFKHLLLSITYILSISSITN